MKILFLLLIILFAESGKSQQGWIMQSSGTVDSLQCVKFINLLTGWAAGTNGVIIKSTNSGNVWTQQISGTDYNLNSISVGISSTDTLLFICGNNGLILRSSDSGNNWSNLNSGLNSDLNSVVFINAFSGWICGDNGNILRTTNGGDDWVLMNSSTDIQLNSIFFTDQNSGWAAGFGGIFHTSNGGLNWTSQFIDGFLVLNCLFFSDTVNGWSAYYDNQTFGPEITKTTDGGESWINYPMNNSYSKSLYFFNSHKGWSSGFYGRINYTSDGGINWIDQTSNTGEHLNSVFFIDSVNGWIAGNAGIMLKTTNGGILTGIVSDSYEDRNYRLHQNYPNPFNSETIIDFEILREGFIKIYLYSNSGRLVSILKNEYLTSGFYTVKFNAGDFPSGIYFYKIESDRFSDVKKMIHLK